MQLMLSYGQQVHGGLIGTYAMQAQTLARTKLLRKNLHGTYVSSGI